VVADCDDQRKRVDAFPRIAPKRECQRPQHSQARCTSHGVDRPALVDPVDLAVQGGRRAFAVLFEAQVYRRDIRPGKGQAVDSEPS